MENLLSFDIETYPNIFSLVAKHERTGKIAWFEISERRNHTAQLFNFLCDCSENKIKMVGYNNVGFDYPVVHQFLTEYSIYTSMSGIEVCYKLYEKAQAIIDCQDRFAHTIWGGDMFIEQVDLYKIHHFDNMARATSLKTLEFNMGSSDIEDLPFEPGQPIPLEGFNKLIEYNAWDVAQTSKFLHESMGLLKFRETMSEMLKLDCTNFNDVKIGKQLFVNTLEEKNPGSCYEKVGGRRQPRQTLHASLNLGDVILPYVKFEHLEFIKMQDWMASQTITQTKGTFKNLSCTVDGFKYVFGLGGIHGSISSTTVEEDEEFVIIDYDVTSYYPSISIVNKLYPEHLGIEFCNVYEQLFQERKKHPKGSPENLALKLALNGTYGASNDKYSPFFDSRFTMAITINGQLSLCMLAEQLIKIPNCSVIQVNTDGLSVRLPRAYSDGADSIVEWWERLTKLNMERADYSKMCIRDVNNYIAVGTDGKVKRKGCYSHGGDLGWHQNHSGQIVAIVAEKVLIEGKDPLQCLLHHPNKLDFLMCTKVPRSSKLFWGKEQTQNICRYTVTNKGEELTKVMPPLKNKTEWREFCINKGYKVSPCNKLNEINLDFNYEFYLNEINKITKPLLKDVP